MSLMCKPGMWQSKPDDAMLSVGDVHCDRVTVVATTQSTSPRQQTRFPKASERTRYERLLAIMDDLDRSGRLHQLLGRSLPLAANATASIGNTPVMSGHGMKTSQTRPSISMTEASSGMYMNCTALIVRQPRSCTPCSSLTCSKPELYPYTYVLSLPRNEMDCICI